MDQLIAAKAASAQMAGSVDVVDDYTVRINLTGFNSTVLGNFSQTGGLMVSPTACQTNRVDWAVKNPVGTGPFKFVNWKSGTSMSYSKFDGYWQQGKPYLDGVQFVFIVDDLTREVSLRAGEIDSAYALIQINLPKLKADGFVVASRPTGSGTQVLVPDSANPKSPFADIRVRQAAAYAIDNATLVKTIFGDLGAVATNQLTWPGYWAYDPSIVGYPYDSAKAKQLLTAAGYPNGFQTRLVSANDTSRLAYGTGVQGYLKAVGIDAAVDSMTITQSYDFQFIGKTWRGLALGRSSAEPDWVSRMSAMYTGNGSYVNMLVPDDYAQAINSALTAPDQATKQKFAQQANKLAIDKYCLLIAPYAPLDTYTIGAYVHNTGFQETSNIVWFPENAWLGKR